MFSISITELWLEVSDVDDGEWTCKEGGDRALVRLLLCLFLSSQTLTATSLAFSFGSQVGDQGPSQSIRYCESVSSRMHLISHSSSFPLSSFSLSSVSFSSSFSLDDMIRLFINRFLLGLSV